MYSKFIPDHFIENFDQISKYNYIRTSGYVMFADLSGFTAMSEKLSTKGNEGSEEISRILNSIFEDLIGIVHRRRGSVYKFGGDALTIFFPKNIPARSVNNCGIEIVKAMKKYSSIDSISGKIRIEVKVGTSFGDVIIGQLGRDEKDYFIAGQALDRACDCEHHAEKGESLVDCAFRFKLGMCAFQQKSEGHFIAENLEELFDNGIAEKVHYKDKKIEMFTRKVLLDKEEEGDFGQGELRNCTVLFMSYSGIKYDENFNYPLLDDLVTSVFKITSKYGGFVNKVDMGDKGNKIIILFGAPAATEKNEELAGRCALEIISSLKGDIKAKIGLNSGNIYFGVIGSKSRLEFTVIGNTVNLAARLMTSCRDNEIIVSKSTLLKISSAVTVNERTLALKGIKEKSYVSTLQSIDDKKSLQRVHAIGRDKEISEYTSLIREGRIKKIFITAEAGMGKSVLAKEFQDIAALHGNIVTAECLSYSSESPYFIAKELINKFLDNIAANKIFALKKILADIKESGNIDIYSDFLGLSRSKVKPDESMKNIIEDVTISIFMNYVVNYNSYIFIEDVHWIDERSLKILRQVLSIMDKTAGVLHLIYRPDDRLSELTCGKHEHIFNVESFGKDAGRLYIETKFNIRKMPANIYDIIYSRSKGNPFFMDEIILSIKGIKGLKIQTDGSYCITQKLKEITIPENVNDIILSRLDKLDNKSKRILKIASVIGRIFQINVLNQLKDLQQKVSELNLKSRLFDLTEMNFTMFEVSKDDEYLFKHAMTRDAVYETLLFSIRRKYHEEIAKIYEENSKEIIENFYELLAFHYKNSGNSDKAKQYIMLSAEKSYRNFAYDSALNYIAMYRKLKLSNDEKAKLYLFEAEVLRILEKRDKAIELCEKAKKLSDKGSRIYDRAVAQNTVLYFKSSRYDKVFKESELLSEKSDVNLFAKVISFRGFSQLFSGLTADSEKTAASAYSLKNKLTDQRVSALVLNLMGTISLHKRKVSVAKAYFEDMLKISEENNLSDERLKALQNISVCYSNTGEYKKAKEYLDKLYLESVKIHNYDLIIVSINNLASISYATGDYKSAEHMAEKGLRMAQKYKKFTLIDDILGSLSNIKLEQEKYEEVLKICSKRMSLVEEHNNMRKIPVIKDIMGDAYFQSGDFETALKIYTENLDAALKISDIERIGHSYGNIANCYSETGKYDISLKYYDMQLKYAAEHEDIQSEGKALLNIADTYFRGLKDNKSALEYAKKAKIIFHDIGYEYGKKLASELLKEIKGI